MAVSLSAAQLVKAEISSNILALQELQLTVVRMCKSSYT